MFTRSRLRAPLLRTLLTKTAPLQRRTLIAAPKPDSGPLMERRSDRALPPLVSPHRWLRTLPIFAAVMAACTLLRTHLFIWTVFSPKYLYAMAWAVGWHLFVSVGLGRVLWWAGGVV